MGELLCLGQRGLDKDPLNPTMLDNLFAEDRTQGNLFGFGRQDDAEVAQAYAAERGKLEKLLTLLEEAVACDALRAGGLPGAWQLWRRVVLTAGYLCSAGCRRRSSTTGSTSCSAWSSSVPIRTLPGLEAMMPGSA